MFSKSITLLAAAIVTLASFDTADPGAAGDALCAESRMDHPAATLRLDLSDGNAELGRELFVQGNLACRACHSLEPDNDRDSAPTLFGIASRATREEIVQSILDPSADFAPGYKTVTIYLRDTEDVFTGRLLAGAADYVILQDNAGKEVCIERSAIKTIQVGLSDMPSGLTDHLTPQQFADLVAFLTTLTTLQRH